MDGNIKLSRRPWLQLGLSIFAFLVFVSVSCIVPKNTAGSTIPAVKLPTTAKPVAPVATVEIQKSQEPPVDIQESQVSPVANVARDFYGPACESGEEEGAPYRWSVELLQNPVSGQLEGTIKFHACPGGGRAVYRVSGTTGSGTTFTLAGKKMDGGGDLFGTAPQQETFTFDPSSGQITPNLAP